MEYKRYAVTFTGLTPLLMHHDNLAWTDVILKWREDPANKKFQVKGDDRSPAWVWMGYLYQENGKVCLPSDNIMTLMREGGVKCPTGAGKGTFKSQSQSGLMVDQSSWPLLVNGKEVPYSEIYAQKENNDFQEHEALAQRLGFELFTKRAVIGSSKHVRVRPRFNNWSASGTITVLDAQITTQVLTNILTFGGMYAGLCDWRPSSKRAPGSFGKFSVGIKEIKA